MKKRGQKKYRRRWFKMGHDRMMRNQIVWNQDDELLGLFTRLQCLVAATITGFETGMVCTDDGKRCDVDYVCLQLARGNFERVEHYRQQLDKLAMMKEVCGKTLKNGFVKLTYFKHDQEEATDQEAERKRRSAAKEVEALAVSLSGSVKEFVGKVGRDRFTNAELVAFVRKRASCYTDKAQSVIDALVSLGVLVRDEDALLMLAALASPPESGSAGAEHSGSRNIPLDGDGEAEPDKEGDLMSPQLDQLDTGSAGGARRVPPKPLVPHGSGSGTGPGGGGGERSEHFVHRGRLHSPEDAWHVNDPLKASIDFLRTKPGWVEEQTAEEKRVSPAILKKKWRTLRRDEGVKVAEKVWRRLLFRIVEDEADRMKWNSWVKVFISRIEATLEVVKMEAE